MTDELKNILVENGLGEYSDLFDKNKLDSIDILTDITETDYEKMGISVMGDRKKLLKLFFKAEVKEQRSPSPEPAPTPTVIVEQKKTHGVWIFVGVLIAILLVIGIIGSM
jgi:hypothetical protein